eukprot:Tamp_33729.p2 GENE.Tamp_33729~~Tamp_33729.p2  ORF type:complete len:139 (+),score=2.02 Tamp_33729:3-419(+)
MLSHCRPPPTVGEFFAAGAPAAKKRGINARDRDQPSNIRLGKKKWILPGPHSFPARGSARRRSGAPSAAHESSRCEHGQRGNADARARGREGARLRGCASTSVRSGTARALRAARSARCELEWGSEGADGAITRPTRA